MERVCNPFPHLAHIIRDGARLQSSNRGERLHGSIGYRPLKSAHQALTKARINVKQYDWVIDMDIKGFFDNISHELILKALDKVVEEKWVKMYCKRWLEMPVQKIDRTIIAKEGRGTPQGGVVSPLLANLFLHYAFDMWITRKYPEISFERYADDSAQRMREGPT